MMFADWFSADTVAPVALKLAGKLAEKFKDPALRKLRELEVVFQLGFNKYIRHQIDRYDKVKTILGTNTPLRLQYIYINLYATENVSVTTNAGGYP
jgi:hypothetical protein